MAVNKHQTPLNISAADAWLVLLHAQGLLDNPDRRVTPAVVAREIKRLGFVQLDSINALERAHHLTLRTRLESYQPDHLRILQEEKRTLFEHWTHDASILPLEFYSAWHHRRERFVNRPRLQKWIRKSMGADSDRVLQSVHDRIMQDGPLQSRDFEKPQGTRTSSWWGWKPAKAALEYLWWKGELGVAGRPSFQKVYDLTERLYPDHHDARMLDEREYIEWMCAESMNRLVIATAAELAAFFAGITVQEAAAWLKRAVSRGDVIEVKTTLHDGAERACYALADVEKRIAAAQRACNQMDDRVRILAPFDPVIRERARLERLTGFRYRFEAFTPAPKRTYGYYVLPLLERDRFVGRTDCAFDRKRSTLLCKGVWWEQGVSPPGARNAALEESLHSLARFLNASYVEVPAAL
ncbi:MAG: winged helix-turn-helix domain-containing protein [Phycisphaerales bacterium]